MAEVKYEGLELWNKVEKSDTRYLKRVEYGKRSFTTIDAYYQIKTATSLWGPMGYKWGLRNIQVSFQDISTKDGLRKLLILQADFYYPGGEFPIINSIYVNDDEATKKIYTDTLTKALSYLGYNADVFLGEYDGNRYVQRSQPQSTNANKTSPQDTKALMESLKKAGVEIKNEGGKLIATGKTYQNSSTLKKLGFVWNPNTKNWEKEVKNE